MARGVVGNADALADVARIRDRNGSTDSFEQQDIETLMTNRQAGRRRGRGGQRSQGGGSRPDSNNRIDSRHRGNAAQLLEKYKNLARDAQMQDDRVSTEMYLQYADHYFRVLNDTRLRAEESNRRQRDDNDAEQDDGDRQDQARGSARGEDGDRERRSGRSGRKGANGAERADESGQDASDTEKADATSESVEEKPRRRGRPRKNEVNAEPAAANDGEGLGADRLPPSLSDAEEKPKPRRRRRSSGEEEAQSSLG
ncbi:DUF4167 domain-containing protein [Stakelama saccharophila]|uniref:DUF4167 domain-containing protein n=1 Tax=Stakelama saccharophila TaxID=3075605 RepID=A0ABZ0BBS6_9SPHN|nr:DUF4167 domain-containing protein [Stakelama sp. W311]WNO54293.1 DUF4167 domain-containing protein [Stakelama sp. W311]